MKKQLLDRATAIHAAKCAKSSMYEAAIDSNESLKSIMSRIEILDNEARLNEVLKEINTWAANSPVVSESDIKELRPRLR